MTSAEDVESFLIHSRLPYEIIAEGTWVLHPESAHNAQIVIKASPPIVLFSIQMFELSDDIKDREGLFRLLLELNGELLHAAYALQGGQVVLAGAQQLENLDINEFQAMVDDMCMALDTHFNRLAQLVAPGSKAAMAEGNV